MRTIITSIKTPPKILLRINSNFNSSSLRLRYASEFGLNLPSAINVITSFALTIIMGIQFLLFAMLYDMQESE